MHNEIATWSQCTHVPVVNCFIIFMFGRKKHSGSDDFNQKMQLVFPNQAILYKLLCNDVNFNLFTYIHILYNCLLTYFTIHVVHDRDNCQLVSSGTFSAKMSMWEDLWLFTLTTLVP